MKYSKTMEVTINQSKVFYALRDVSIMTIIVELTRNI